MRGSRVFRGRAWLCGRLFDGENISGCYIGFQQLVKTIEYLEPAEKVTFFRAFEIMRGVKAIYDRSQGFFCLSRYDSIDDWLQKRNLGSEEEAEKIES